MINKILKNTFRTFLLAGTIFVGLIVSANAAEAASCVGTICISVSVVSDLSSGAIYPGTDYSVVATISNSDKSTPYSGSVDMYWGYSSPSNGFCSGKSYSVKEDSSTTVSCRSSGDAAGNTVYFQANTTGNGPNWWQNTIWSTASYTSQTPPKSNQTISFSSPSAGTSYTYGSTFTATASATSGLDVSLGAGGSCSIPVGTLNSGTVTINSGSGTCTITASQGGGSSYNAATDVSVGVNATKKTITVTADDKSKTQGSANPSLTASYSGFVNSQTTGNLDEVASLGTTATASSPAGTYTITPSGAVSSYYSFSYVNGTLTVSAPSKLDPGLSFPQPTTPVAYNSSFTLPGPTTSSGGTMRYGVLGVCSLDQWDGATVTMNAGSGNCVITVTQDTTSTYLAGSYSKTVVATTASQTITFNALVNKTMGDADFAPGATGGSSTSGVTYSASPAGVCTIVSGNVHLVGAGTSCTVTASQAGDSNYSAATSVPRSFTVNPSAPTQPTVTPSTGSCGGNINLTLYGGGSGGTSFKLYRNPDANGSAGWGFISSATTLGGLPSTQTGLNQGGTYNFQVEASNAGGSAYSTIPNTATASGSCFDYSLSVPMSPPPLVQGNQAVVYVDSTLLSSQTQGVSISLSGLPVGVTYVVIAPTTKNPPASYEVTLTATAGATTGTKQVIVTATSSGGPTKTTTFNLTVAVPTVTASLTARNDSGAVVTSAKVNDTLYFTTSVFGTATGDITYTGHKCGTGALIGITESTFTCNYTSTGDLVAGITVTQQGISVVKSKTINVTAPDNTLRIVTSNNGEVVEPGVSIEFSTGLVVPTTYTESGQSTIDKSFYAPTTFGGSVFLGWSGCDSVSIQTRRCYVAVANGSTKTPTANYGDTNLQPKLSAGIGSIQVDGSRYLEKAGVYATNVNYPDNVWVVATFSNLSTAQYPADNPGIFYETSINDEKNYSRVATYPGTESPSIGSIPIGSSVKVWAGLGLAPIAPNYYYVHACAKPANSVTTTCTPGVKVVVENPPPPPVSPCEVTFKNTNTQTGSGDITTLLEVSKVGCDPSRWVDQYINESASVNATANTVLDYTLGGWRPWAWGDTIGNDQDFHSGSFQARANAANNSQNTFFAGPGIGTWFADTFDFGTVPGVSTQLTDKYSRYELHLSYALRGLYGYRISSIFGSRFNCYTDYYNKYDSVSGTFVTIQTQPHIFPPPPQLRVYAPEAYLNICFTSDTTGNYYKGSCGDSRSPTQAIWSCPNGTVTGPTVKVTDSVPHPFTPIVEQHTLNVKSNIDDVSSPGTNITQVGNAVALDENGIAVSPTSIVTPSEGGNFGGKTDYSRTTYWNYKVTLSASNPHTTRTGTFVNWSGCDAPYPNGQGQNCTVSFVYSDPSGGQSKIITANYISTPPPSQPNVVPSAGACGARVNLAYTLSPTATLYKLYRGTADQSPYTQPAIPAYTQILNPNTADGSYTVLPTTDPDIIIPKLVAGTTYFYQVQAINVGGSSYSIRPRSTAASIACFNYSLSASPTNVSLAAGASGSTAVTKTLVTGVTQLVTLSVSIPNITGLTAIVADNNPGNPTNISTINITSTPATPAGIYTATVTGTSANTVDKTTTFTITIGAPVVNSLTVTKSGTGAGTVTSSPTGITCGSTCSSSFTKDSNVILSSVSALGTSANVVWTGCISTTAADQNKISTCTVNMSTAKTVDVQYTQLIAKATLQADGTHGETVASGAQPRLTWSSVNTTSANCTISAPGFSQSVPNNPTQLIPYVLSNALYVDTTFTLTCTAITGTGGTPTDTVLVNVKPGSGVGTCLTGGACLSVTPTKPSCTTNGGTMNLSYSDGGNATLYKLYRNTADTSPYALIVGGETGVAFTSLPSTDPDTIIPKLVSGTIYFYQLEAINSHGSAFSSRPKSDVSSDKCFNYSLSAPNVSVVAGNSVTNTVTETLLAGVTQAVSLSIDKNTDGSLKLPNGVAVTFAPTSASPTASVVMTITTTLGTLASGGTQPGIYAIVVNGSPLSKSTTFNLTVTNPSYILTTTKSGSGTGVVSSIVPATSPFISCGATCATSFVYPTQVTLTATPDVGSTFTGWSGGGCSGVGTCVVTMTVAKTVNAVFKQEKSSLDIKADTSDGPITVNYASTPNLTWTSLNTSSCSITASPAVSGFPRTGLGSNSTNGITTPALIVDTTFTLNCVANIGFTPPIVDIVVVNVKPVSGATCLTGGACLSVTPTKPSCTTNGGTMNLSYSDGGNATLYKLYRNTADTSPYALIVGGETGVAFTSLPSTDPDTIIPKLVSGTIYFYQLEAINSHGSAFSSRPKSDVSSDKCFNYSLSAPNVSVVAGNSVTNTVTETLLAGVTQAVSLSIDKNTDGSLKLPNGVAVTFAPTSASPTASVVMTITTTLGTLASGGTQPGIYAIVVNGSPLSKSTTFNLTVTNPSYILTTTKSGSGTGVVSSIVPATSPFISCGATCATSFVYPTQVTLTATPDVGSTFTGWSGGGCSGVGTCVVTMTVAKTVNAVFKQEKSSLDIKADTSDGPITVNYASTPNLTWTSLNTSSCSITASPAVSGFPRTGLGSNSTNGITTPALIVDTTFTLNCVANIGFTPPIVDIVVVNVKPVSGATCLTGGACLSVTPTKPSCTTNGGTMNLSYSDGGNATLYKLYRNTADTSPYALIVGGETGVAFTSLPSTDPDTIIPKLVSGTIYFYQLEAINSHGSAFSSRPKSDVSSDKCFNYSLSAPNVSVVAGNSVTNTVTETLLAGVTQAVSLSIDKNTDGSLKLPNGVAVTFAPTSASPTASVVMTITTTLGTLASGGTQPGIYAIVVNGSPLSKSTTFNLTVTNPSYILTTTKSGSGTGVVSSIVPATSPFISCGATCATSFVYPTQVTLTATPDVGSTFTGWSGGGCSGVGTCVVTMTVAKTVNAVFKQEKSSLDIKADTSDGPITVNYASTPNLTWTSLNTSSCSITASPAVSGFPRTGLGSNSTNGITTPALIVDTTFKLNCVANIGFTPPIADIVVVNVKPVSGATCLTGGACLSVTPTKPSCTTNGGTMNLSYSDGGNATLYKLYRNTADTSPYALIVGGETGVAFTSLPSTDPDTIIPKLVSGTIYFYQLEAINSHGSAFSSRPKSDVSSDKCFNYSLSAPNVSVVAGNSVTNTVTETLLAGVTQAVSLSIDKNTDGSLKLPNGVAVTFAPTSASPTASVVMTITTTLGTLASGGTQPGIYAIVVNGSPLSKSTTFNLTVTNPSYILTTTKSGSGTGVVSSIVPATSPFISCGATCATSFVYPTQVTLTATPDVGSSFTGWSGGGCSGVGTCVVTMTVAKTVNAVFTQINASIDSFTATTPVSHSAASTLAWTTSNMSSCSISADRIFTGYPKSVAANGTLVSSPLTQDPVNFTLTCTKNPGTVGVNIATAVVRVLPQPVDITGTPGTCGGNITLGYSGGANSTSNTLNRNPYSTAGTGWGVIATGPQPSNLPTAQSGLLTGTPYSYQVLSTNGAGSVSGNQPSVTSSIPCFNYSLSASNVSVVAGNSVTNTVTETLLAGVTQAVTLTSGSLPNGVTVTFAPTSASPTASVVMTITTTLGTLASGGTQPGIYAIVVNGSPLSKSTTFNLTVTNPSYILTTTKSGSGTGVVSSIVPATSPFISCGATCATSFVYPTQVTLTATPDVGSSFTGWSGGGCSGVGTCVVTMTVAKTVNAVFTQINASIDSFTATTPVSHSAASTLAWTTSNMSSCSISADRIFTGYPKSVAANGTLVSSPLTQDPVNFTLTCTKNPGTVGVNIATAVVRVLPQPVDITGTPGTCGGNITLGYSGGANSTSNTLNRNPYSTAGTGWGVIATGPQPSNLPTAQSGLLTGTPYSYQVLSTNGAGSVSGNQPSVTSSIPCFNYSLSASNVSVVAGNSVTNTVTETLLAGVTQAVTLTSGSLPNGVTVTFAPTSASPTASVVMTITTTLGTLASGGTQPGIYAIVVNGSPLSKSTTFNLTVTNPSYILTTTKSGSGTGVVSSIVPATSPFISCGATCATSFVYPTQVTLTATPDVGSSFTGWSGGGCSGVGTCVVTMTVAKTVNAVFTQINASIDSFTATTPVSHSAASTLAWTTSNMSSCSISADRIFTGYPKSVAANGTLVSSPLTQDPVNFTLTCTKNPGTVGVNIATAVVRVLPQPVDITGTPGTCGGNITLGYSGGANSVSYELSRNPYSTLGSGWGVIGNGTLLSSLSTSQSNLIFNTNYQYQVKSTNSAGNASGAIVSVTSSIDCTLGATLGADKASGTAPLASILTATPTGTVSGTPTYRFKCTDNNSWSVSQSGNTYTCNYAVLGSYNAWVEIVKGGKTATASLPISVSATPMIDLKVNGVDTTIGAPLNVPYGSGVTLTWTSASISNANKPCTINWNVVGNSKRNTPDIVGESVTVNALNNTYTISCPTVNGDIISDSVYVNTAPSQPTIIAVTTFGANSCGGKINLTYGGGTGATSYKLYRNTVDSAPYTQIASSQLAQDTGLVSGTRYFYQLEAINAAGSSYSSRPISALASVTCVPTVDLKIAGSNGPVNVDFYATPPITWVTTGDPTVPTVCSATGSSEWSTSKPPSDNNNPTQSQPLSAQNCTTPRTYSLSCSNSAGTGVDSVVVNITGIPASTFSLQATPVSGKMNFYGPRASSDKFKVTVNASDQCDLDAGKNVVLSFAFKKGGAVVTGASVAPLSASLTAAEFSTGVDIQVNAISLLIAGNYDLVVTGTRNGKTSTVTIPIVVVVLDPSFKEF